jgi:hypothetical protein
LQSKHGRSAVAVKAAATTAVPNTNVCIDGVFSSRNILGLANVAFLFVFVN